MNYLSVSPGSKIRNEINYWVITRKKCCLKKTVIVIHTYQFECQNKYIYTQFSISLYWSAIGPTPLRYFVPYCLPFISSPMIYNRDVQNLDDTCILMIHSK